MEKAPCAKCKNEKYCNEGTIKKPEDCSLYQKWVKTYRRGGKKK